MLIEAYRSTVYPFIDFVHERLIDVGNRDGVFRAVRKIADRIETGSVERLDLSGFELLIEGAVIEPRLALARLNETFNDDEDGNDRQNNEDDGSKMFAQGCLDRLTFLEFVTSLSLKPQPIVDPLRQWLISYRALDRLSTRRRSTSHAS